MDFFFSQAKKKQYLLLLVDIFIILLSIGASYIIRFLIHQESIAVDNIIVRLDLRHLLLVFTYIFSLYIFSQYNLNQIVAAGNFPKILFMALTVGVVLTSSIFYFFPKYIFGRTALLSHYALMLLLISFWRIVFVKFILKGEIAKKILVVGDKEQVDRFLEDIKQHLGSSYEIAGAHYRDAAGFRPNCDADGRCNPNVDEVLANENFDLLIYDTKCRNFDSFDIEIILQLKYKGKTIYDIPTFYQDVIGKAPIEFIDNVWMLFNTQLQRREKQYYVRAKRLMDFGLSLLLLILLAPMMLIVSAIIRMSSNGSVLFRQERLCAQGGKFDCIKFRTMSVETDDVEKRPQWATNESNRITPLGRFLRKTRLDELPQLWNIIKGDMSFVGPRPIREHFANELAKEIPFYNLRFMVKPGLSGWAQVNLGYADSLDSQREKFTYELFYLQNMSFLLDTIIILKTIQKVLRGEGA